MVIHQFNKLIRNKWVWGVFAIVVCLAFVAPDDWFRGDEEKRPADESRLENDKFDADLFRDCEFLVSAFIPEYVMGRNAVSGMQYIDAQIASFFTEGQGRRRFSDERSAWKAYAAVKAFREAGYDVPDAMLAARIREDFTSQDGVFSDAAYKQIVKRNFGVEPKVFETQLRLWMTIQQGLFGIERSKTWGSSMEFDQACRDFTDKFTVQVATFNEDKAAADAVKLDDAGLKAWYDKNIDSLAIPERFKLSYVRFDADASNLLAAVEVTEEAIQARYDENSSKGMYDVPPATTNDVKTVKPLEDVRAAIETALRHELSLEALKADIESRLPYYEDIDELALEEAAKFLPSLAAEKGAELKESDWVSLGSTRVPGFVASVSAQFPGVKRDLFNRKAQSLIRRDSLVESVDSDKYVWVVALSACEDAVEKPAFDLVKDKIGDMALRDAKADAFKATVEAVAKKGAEAVLASGNVTTNLTFSPSAFASDYAFGWMNMRGEWDFKLAGFQNAQRVVFAARKLGKGEVSEYIPLGTGRAALVVCNDRVPGDVAQLWRGETFAARVAAAGQSIDSFGEWLEENLKKRGYKDRSSRAAAEPAAPSGAENGDDD